MKFFVNYLAAEGDVLGVPSFNIGKLFCKKYEVPIINNIISPIVISQNEIFFFVNLFSHINGLYYV